MNKNIFYLFMIIGLILSCNKSTDKPSGSNSLSGVVYTKINSEDLISYVDSTSLIISHIDSGLQINLSFSIGVLKWISKDTFYNRELYFKFSPNSLPALNKIYSTDSNNFKITYIKQYYIYESGNSLPTNEIACYYYSQYPDNINIGKMIFSKFDTINNLCSGTFNFTLYSASQGCYPTMNMTNGYFNDLKIIKN